MNKHNPFKSAQPKLNMPKSELTTKLEAALEQADTTVKAAQQYVGAKALRTAAMATHHLIGEAMAASKKLDETPAPPNNPPAT